MMLFRKEQQKEKNVEAVNNFQTDSFVSILLSLGIRRSYVRDDAAQTARLTIVRETMCVRCVRAVRDEKGRKM